MYALRVRFRYPMDQEMEVETMTVYGNAENWNTWIKEATAKGMRTVGELLAYLAAKEAEAKKPRAHCIEKYDWRWL